MLRGRGMKALISTPGYLLFCDLERRATRVVARDAPEYYGISWTRDGRELITTHSGIRNDTLVDLAAYAVSEKGWLRIGGRDLDAVALSQPHQAVAGPGGTVLVTNTGRNCLSVVDPLRQSVREIRLSPGRWDRLSGTDRSGNHLNSVWADERFAYVLAHNFERNSFVAKCSLEDFSVVETVTAEEALGAHNVWPMPDGGLMVCASRAGGLMDIRRNAVLWSSGTMSWTRGLAVTADHILVGESEHAPRSDRGSGLSGVWVLDRHRFRTVDYLCLGPYGGVHEIRVLDLPDEAHHGIPFADPDALWREDVLAGRERRRMAQSAAAAAGLAQQQGLRALFGRLVPGADGQLRAGGLAAALFRQPWAEDRTLAYDFGAAREEQHLGLLLRYGGSGGDTDATVAILSPAADGRPGRLGLWEHDGQGWREVSGQALPVARAGRLAVTREGGTVWLGSRGEEGGGWRQPLPGMPVGLRLSNCTIRLDAGGSGGAAARATAP